MSEPAGSNYLRMFIPILLLSIFQLGSFALAQEQYLIPPLTGGIQILDRPAGAAAATGREAVEVRNV